MLRAFGLRATIKQITFTSKHMLYIYISLPRIGRNSSLVVLTVNHCKERKVWTIQTTLRKLNQNLF